MTSKQTAQTSQSGREFWMYPEPAQISFVALINGKRVHIIHDASETDSCARIAEITNLDNFVVKTILNDNLEEIRNNHAHGRRCMLVIETDSYPLLLSSVNSANQNAQIMDSRGHNYTHDYSFGADAPDVFDTSDEDSLDCPEDPFSAELKTMWNWYNIASCIPVMIMNSKIPHTGLRCINY